MPETGEIRKAKELGYTWRGNYIWQACPGCGKQRWVALRRGKPTRLRCNSCAHVGERSSFWKGGRTHNSKGYQSGYQKGLIDGHDKQIEELRREIKLLQWQVKLLTGDNLSAGR